MKSLLLAVLMVSMSLSVGLVELNKVPWIVEDAESELEEINKPMHTTAPSISYSPSTLSLVNNTAMTPTTPTNAGGDFTVGVAAHIAATSGFDIYETFTSMGIDSNDDVHFSYHISSVYSKDLGYATNSGGSWANTTIDSTGDVGMHTSLAIDSNDVVHISYTDMTNSDLKYATCSSSCTSSTSWTNTTVDTAGGEDTSIAIDSNNDVHISYYDDDNDELKYATCSSSCSSSSSWTTTSVDTSGIGDNNNVQDRTSIAIDSNDELHVSYGDKTNSKLKYATCSSSCSSSSSWSSTTLISTSAYTPNNMAIDSNDNLHISFKSTGLRYASCSSSCSTASSWTFITIDTGTQAGKYNSIALDSNDVVHISYQSDYAFPVADLKYATCASSCSAASSWYNHTIDSSVPVNYEAVGLSMGIDSDNKSHIIYQRVYNSSWEIAYTGTGSNGYSVSPDLPSGLSLNWVNGTISGTPTSFSSSATYTITAKNAYGSTTTTLTISVNTPPLISYDLGTGDTVYIVQNTPMSSLSPTLTTGFSAPTSCSHTGLPSGLLLSSTCVLSGTPTTLGSTTLTITPSNIAGTGTATSFIVNVNASGGSIIINTTSTEANLGIAISNITMSYTHTASVQNWTSGVTNTTIEPVNTFDAISRHEMDSGLHGDIAIVYSIKRGGASSASLTLLYKWDGAWTESTIDSSVDTEVPSVAIDRQGALHIGYIDKDNSKLKYATNATGSWVIETLGDAATDSSAQTATSVHLVTNAVHIMAVNDSTSNTGVNHYTNETGTWLSSTISDPSEDEGYGVQADIDPDGNLHVVFRREDGNPDDLILASRINGFWQNQTITTELYNGADAGRIDMDIDSQGQIHVVYQNRLNLGKRLSYGVLTSVNPGVNWDFNDITNVGFWPTLAIDLNDDMHVSYHVGSGPESKDQWYVTNTSGSWNSPIETSATAGSIRGGFFGDMAVDSNNDVFVVALGGTSCLSCELRLTRIQGTGIGQAINPIFEVSPPLPDGLNMNWHNGTISGTPTETYGNTTHTVTVTAFGATTTETFTLMVIEAPDISYSNAQFIFTKNSHVSGTTPTNIGGVADSWTVISGTLPNGVTLDPSTGELVGTPTAVSTTQTIVIQATNLAGSDFATISITVQDEAPDISYSQSSYTFTKNTEVVGETPTNVGGAVSTWAIHPVASSLPNGLLFGPSNGTIYGTPTTVVSSAVTFTIWANNSADSNSTTITINVRDEAPSTISYPNSPYTFTKNDPASGAIPTYTAGAPTSWTITAGTMPAGLSVDPSTGEIIGTPTTVTPSTVTITIKASNPAGDDSTTVDINVQDEAPSTISYLGSPYIFTKNSMVTVAAPTYTDGAPTSWSIDSYDDLPAGIEFDNVTGEITGTPTAVTATVTFTVWGNNSAGDISTTIEMTVNDIVPAFTYTSLEVELTNNSATIISPISTGGTITSWVFVGTEPNGLNFGPGNGTIWGTPIDVQSKTQYLIWGNNSGGELLVYLNITISDVPVVFSYAADNYNLTRNEPIATPINPVSNGIVDTWEIEPLLTGTGLSFDPLTGEISGTPIINMTRTQYTVWANNTGGNVSQSFNITINEPRVGLDYSRENEIFVTGTTISPLYPTVTGGMVETWEYEGTLPNGLFFTNGVFTGTPTTVTPQTMITVWANNTGGAINHTLNFTVNAPGVELDYIPDYAIITIGQPMTALTPIVSNATLADVDTWSIYPELDNGLSFGTNNGTIWGTPTSIQPIQLYKIWANNTGGKSYHDINITILDIVPEISYSLVNIELTNDTVSIHLPLNPTNLGGPVVTWSITPELSSGLIFDALTGTISGTPDEVKASEIYTVSATNSGGTDTTQIEITVIDQVPMIAYVPSEEILLSNSSVLNMVPESTGGAITQWSITPEPSAGLFFDTSTGIFSGTATEIKVRTEYVITATNDVDSMSFNVNVTVEEFDYDLSIGPIYLLVNEEILSIGPSSTLSDSVYEISPDLPDGMFIGESNGTIWGTPTDDIQLTNFTIYANNSLFNEVMVIQIGVLDDSDSDGMPNQLPLDYNPSGGLVEDLDDDADGFSDAEEVNCATDPLDVNSLITDLDGDSICDELDDDIDGDGLLNDVETNSSTYVDQNNTGTDLSNADSDGDGVCDGPEVPANGGCSVGPDAFPFDSAGSMDSDGDGMPDTLNGESTSTPPLVEDLDDDNDTWLDEMEADCGTDSIDQNSVPEDEDSDRICDPLDTILDLPFTMTYPSDTLTLTLGEEIAVQLPTVSGLGEVSTWEISSELPAGLIFGWSPARDAHLDGSITGSPTEAMDATQFTIWANNSAHSQSFNITISVLEEVIDSEDDDEDESSIFMWSYICLPLILLLLLLLFVILIPGNKQVIDDAEPENTTSTPNFVEGEGTRDNPFVLKPANDITPGDTIYSEELITITNITPGLKIQSIDYLDQQGGHKFTMADLTYGNEEVRMFEADEEGVIKFQLIFDDSSNPTLAGGEYQGAIKIGRNSVYLIWDIKVKSDPEYVKQQESLESGSEKVNADAEAEEKAEAKAKAEAKVKAQTEAETQKLKAKKLEELARVRARANTIDFATLGVATIDHQDDLQEIKGIGPFIAEKLNALGIYTFAQVGNMTPKIEEEVNQAIEFFSGRVKRDQWAKQAKELAKNKK